MSSTGISLRPYSEQNSLRASPALIVTLILAFILSFTLVNKAAILPSYQQPAPQADGQTKVMQKNSATVDAVKTIGQSVVTIIGTPVAQQDSFTLGDLLFGSVNNTQSSQDQTQNIGSGFILSSNGLIATNKHVVSDQNMNYQVITANNKTYNITNIYQDPNNDVAIIRIDSSQHSDNKLKPADLGDSADLQVGQFVVAIGTALGEFRNTVTTGVISGLGRGITAADYYQRESENLNNLIQTSAAVNPGNSGGPLVDANKRVIAMNTAIAIDGQNIGFALPINVVKDFLNSI